MYCFGMVLYFCMFRCNLIVVVSLEPFAVDHRNLTPTPPILNREQHCEPPHTPPTTYTPISNEPSLPFLPIHNPTTPTLPVQNTTSLTD